MKIVEFPRENREKRREAAALLRECFPRAYLESAEEQVSLCLEAERIALMAEENSVLVGFIGAIPQYGITAWELHPLAVSGPYRGRRIGTALIQALEEAVKQRGCFTLYLGTDDEEFQTSLSQGDLFENTLEKIRDIKNLHRHPYEFYEKNGFQIVGVLPDANGPGKPDIFMAKRMKAESAKA